MYKSHPSRPQPLRLRAFITETTHRARYYGRVHTTRVQACLPRMQSRIYLRKGRPIFVNINSLAARSLEHFEGHVNGLDPLSQEADRETKRQAKEAAKAGAARVRAATQASRKRARELGSHGHPAKSKKKAHARAATSAAHPPVSGHLCCPCRPVVALGARCCARCECKRDMIRRIVNFATIGRRPFCLVRIFSRPNFERLLPPTTAPTGDQTGLKTSGPRT